MLRNKVAVAMGIFVVVACAAGVEGGLKKEIGDKTLVVWAAPADLQQKGGSALTLDDMKSRFDGVIFGEIAPGRWMAGSDNHRRSLRDQKTVEVETANADTFVQIAIVYKGKAIKIYRDGKLYSSYEAGGRQKFGPGSVVMFGRRHIDAGDRQCFRGRIDDARIYDRALTAGQIAALRPDEASKVSPLAWWTFEDAQLGDRMGVFAESYLTGGAKTADGCLVLEGAEPVMVAASKGFLGDLLAGHDGRTQSGELVAAQRQLRDKLLSDPHRPKFHFVSPEGRCMPFDCNGAIYWKGRYHLCYIFQDHRGHCWGHASSRDLLHWRWHKPALAPEPGDVDRGIFSGNCFVNKKGEATMLYHGVRAGNCIATCAEPLLENWVKLPANPIVPIPARGSREEKLYRSWDPHGWLEGDTYMAGVDDFEDISCPDFFKLGDKYMLLCISHPRGCRYYLGRWENEQFVAEVHERMNWPGGTCFAPESLLDGKGRRIMWAWVLDRRPQNEYGWSGTMTLPRVLSLGGDGTLGIEPVEELTQLRMAAVRADGIKLENGKQAALKGVKGKCLELDVTVDCVKAERFAVKVLCSPDGKEETAIVFDRRAGTLSIDVRKSSLNDIKYYTFCMKGGDNPQVSRQVAPFKLRDDEMLRLRVFVDCSIVEVFANGRQCVTQRVYPAGQDSTGVVLLAEGGPATVLKCVAWEMAATNQW
jgi:sucrose-6-phosphate hydrolase SacC (GH32 family)